MTKNFRILFSIIVILLVLAAGFYYLGKNKNVVMNPPAGEDTTVVKHFTDANNTFTLSYNSLFTFGESMNEGHSPGTLVAEVNIPRSYMPNTNFSDASFRVSRLTSADAIKNCLVASNGEIDQGPATISGFPFRKITLSDAGAGNFYETTNYKGIVDGDCYVIGYTIHSTNIGNYSPDQGITEFDKAKIQNELEKIVKSLKFLVNSD